MNDVKVLDCTLRDGGYVNNWRFGKNNIKKIVSLLTKANIDIIECGFFSKKKEYSSNQSIFTSFEDFREYIPEKQKNIYVCMINYGDCNIEDIPNCRDTVIGGVRVAFHKHELEDAIGFCREISKKGYMLFIQPMVTVNYSDLELLKLVTKANEIKTYALYIADSFGVMKRNDLLRIFYLLDRNLDKNIALGYHAHNNLQLAYSNAQSIVEIHINRTLIIDSSVQGMGRGAGNLNTELFVQYINEYYNKKYNVYPLLQIIDEVLNKIYLKHYWGYSLPYYLSSIFNCHPNYATYLSEKNTLTIESINKILSEIQLEKKIIFDKEYIEQLYTNFQKNNIDDRKSMEYLGNLFREKGILIIAPGHSLKNYAMRINEYKSSENIILIGVNYIYEDIKCDYTFISNNKRFEQLIENKGLDSIQSGIILTSNINAYDKDIIKVDYVSLLNQEYSISDNSTLMLLKLLIKLEVKKVYLAGFDGYSYNNQENYANEEMIINTSNEGINTLNTEISKFIKDIGKHIELEFITPTKYKKITEMTNNLQY